MTTKAFKQNLKKTISQNFASEKKSRPLLPDSVLTKHSLCIPDTINGKFVTVNAPQSVDRFVQAVGLIKAKCRRNPVEVLHPVADY